jgi:actin-related protein
MTMSFNYEKLEEELGSSCEEVHKNFQKKFSNDVYISAGGSKLEAFIDELQREFETTAANFILKHNITRNSEAKKRVLNITKLYAKRCIDDFSKMI